MDRFARITLTVALVGLMLASLGCAPGPNDMERTADRDGRTAGFFMGVWHGLISPITFVISQSGETADTLAAMREARRKGAIALGIIMIPIILRTTDDMLQLVPGTLREAAFALGAPKYKVIMDVVYRGAKAGILTGVLLGIARVAGETAPLLFTSFNDNFFTTDLNEAMPSLTVTMFNYAISPYEDWQQLGWAAAFILSMFILGLNILGRLILFFGKKRK